MPHSADDLPTHDAVFFLCLSQARADSLDDDGQRQALALVQNGAIAHFDIAAIFASGIFGEFEGNARERIFVL